MIVLYLGFVQEVGWRVFHLRPLSPSPPSVRAIERIYERSPGNPIQTQLASIPALWPGSENHRSIHPNGDILRIYNYGFSFEDCDSFSSERNSPISENQVNV